MSIVSNNPGTKVRWFVCGIAFMLLFGPGEPAQACIWDARTLATEKQEHPTLAQAILSPKTKPPDTKSLNDEIQKLNANPKKDDPAWWNNLAGSYLRLGQPAEAVKILEPLTNRFSNDYGIHANLGTAYHLLGRYTEAEREIRRDTELNTNAHFGLEKYHLALLQYLCRDPVYRSRHVFVDEFSIPFVESPPQIRLLDDFSKNLYATHKIDRAEAQAEEKDLKRFFRRDPNRQLDSDHRQWVFNLIVQDRPPSYRKKWDLGADPKLDEGVIYMATLNPKEPACWVMLGVLAEYHSDYNLAKTAFEEAIALGSPQTPIIKMNLSGIREQLKHLGKGQTDEHFSAPAPPPQSN